MLFKILKEYLRRITRNYKIYAVSILGMSVAIIASFHIYHFAYKELSVDKFHEKVKVKRGRHCDECNEEAIF